jgi:Putative Actinobacterial Holin-X, holin superfamily III
MEALKATAENIIDHTRDLLDTYYKLTVVNATDKATKAATAGMSLLVIGSMALLILIFMGIGFAWWIGEYMDNMKAGFFIVGAAYFLLLMIFVLIRREVVFPAIRNNIIRKIYE